MDYDDNVRREVLISGEDLDQDLLENLFSNYSKTGGGEIDDINIPPYGEFAIITFKDAQDAANVVHRQTTQFGGLTFTASWPEESTQPSSETPPVVVMVTGIGDLDDEMLDMLYTNFDRTGGGPISQIEHEHGYVLITFGSPEDAARVVEQSETVFGKRTLVAEWPCHDDTPSDAARTVQVSGICDFNEDELKIFYSNFKRTSGGGIEHIKINSEAAIATITFCRPEDAARVVKQCNARLQNKTLTATWPQEEEESARETVVQISGIEDLDSETLDMFFSNANKCGGGPINHIDLDSKPGCALIEFTAPEYAANVVKQKTFLLIGKDLTASWIDDKKEQVPRKVVQISGIGDLDADTLDMLYSNGVKTGGGVIEGMDLISMHGCAKITFQDHQIAEAVVRQGEVTFKNLTLVASWPVDEEEEVPNPPRRLVEVSGVGDLDEETIDMLYTNPVKTQGGPIENIELESSKDCAWITFEKAEDAERVVEKRETLFSNYVLIADWPAEEEASAPRRVVMVTGIGGLDIETLEMMYSNCSKTGGGPIECVDLDRMPGCALITFYHQEDAASVVSQGDSKLGKFTLTATWAPDEEDSAPRKSVKITGIGDLEICDIKMLYSNMNKTGGGPIESAHMDAATGCAVITFINPEDATRVVEQRIAKLGNQVLEALWDQPEQQIPPPTVVQISGVRDLDEDMLDMLYTNVDKTSGGPIVSINLDMERDRALITFTDPQDAANVVKQGEAKLGRMILVASWPEEEEPPKRVVKIAGTAEFDEDSMRMLYTNVNKTGGGPIEDIDQDSLPGLTLITFVSHEDAANVVEHREAKFGKQILIASWPEEESFCSRHDMVEISGVAGTDQETLQMLYSSKKKSGGGVIESIEMMSNKALITFKDPQDAADVVNKRTVKFRNNHFIAGWPESSVSPNASFHEHSVAADSTEIVDEPFDTIVVEGLQGDEDEDILKMFLSSFKKSKGGPVKDINLKPGSDKAYVTFQKPEDAARIVSKKTLVFRDKKLPVSAVDSVDGSLSCAIIVSNLLPKTPEDSIALVFEQADIHGFDEEHEEVVFLNDNKETAVVVMRSARAVQNILDYHMKKPLKVRKAKVEVKRLQPAPPGILVTGAVETDKILFRFIEAGVDMAKLRAFIEDGAGADIDHIMYTPKMGVILVYFTGAADYKGMKVKCMSRPLDGKMIGIERVPVTSMIQVLNVTADLEESLEQYLKNTKRSQGGPIKQIVEFAPDQGYAIVEFQSPKSVASVCAKKKHKWDFLIREFYSGVGLLQSDVDYTRPSAWLPEPLQVEWEAVCLQFVFSNARIKREIEEKMSRVWSEIIWPEDPNNAAISLKCVLDSTDPDFAVLMKRWQDDVTDQVRDVLEMIVFDEMNVDPAAWEEFRREARAVEQRSSDAQILYESDSCTLTVVGKEPDISQVYQQLQQIKDQVEYQIHVAENSTTKVVDEIESAKLTVFEIEKWQEAIERKYKNIDITIERGNIVLKGLRENIHDAYEETLEYLTKINNGMMKIENTFQSVLQDAETQTFLQQMTSNLKVVWEVERGVIHFWSVSRAEIDKAKQIINGQLKTEPITIPRECSLLSNTQTLKDTMAKMERQESGKLKIILDLDTCKVRLVGIASCVDASKAQLQQLFKNHKVDDKKIQLPKGKVQFLQKYKMDEVIEIQKELKDCGVNITLNDNEVCISATKQGIDRADKKFHDLANRIVSNKKSIDRPDVAEFLTSEKGKEKVKLLENLHKVIVEMTYGPSSRQPTPSSRHSPGKDFRAGAMSQEKLGFELNGVTFKVVEDDIVRFQNADVIVNSTSTKLELKSGFISRKLLERAPEIQDELHQQFPSGIHQGQVASTSGHDLPCRYVYHAACPKGEQADCDKVLKTLIDNCFHEAVKDKVTSIAFPSIGGGKLNINRDSFAEAIVLTSVEIAQNAEKKGSLSSIYVVLHRSDTSTRAALIKAVNEKGPKESGRGYVDEDEEASANNFLDVSREELPQPGVGSGNKVVGEAQIGAATVQILSGDITAETTDAIVNTTDNKLQNKGRLSQAILEGAGENVKKASMKLKFLPDDAMVTDSGNLPCKKLIHTISGNDEQSWKRSIGACLLEADRNGLRSISFPAMGTGYGQSSVCRQQMASWVAETWEKHVPISPNTKLINIHIVAMKEDLAKEYAQALDNKLRGGFFSWGRSLAFKWFSGGSEPAPQPTKPRRSGEQIPSDKTIPILTIYAERQDTIETFMGKIYEIQSQNYKRLFLDSEQDQGKIRRLSPRQEQQIEQLGGKHNCTIEIQKGKTARRIKIQGFTSNVNDALEDVTKALNAAIDKLDEKEQVEALSKKVTWQYHDGTKYIDYATTLSGRLEKARVNGKDRFEWNEKNGQKFAVDFKTMKESKIGGGGSDVSVKRIVAGEVPLPDTWKPMPSNKKGHLFQLQPGSEEFNKVQSNIMATAGGSIKSIVNIERVQNPDLYRLYILSKDGMDKNNPPGTVNEVPVMWHGTAPTSIPNIIENGLNRAYKSTTAYGQGVYFAVNSQYSAGYARADAQGHKRMFQCRVLKGVSTVGNSSMTEPPPRDPSTGVLFDSTTNNLASPIMYITYDDAHNYPEYLITFT